jgi:hypothetical protein
MNKDGLARGNSKKVVSVSGQRKIEQDGHSRAADAVPILPPQEVSVAVLAMRKTPENSAAAFREEKFKVGFLCKKLDPG